MFKFDFKVEQDDETSFDCDIKSKELDSTPTTDDQEQLQTWMDYDEVVPSMDILENIDVYKLNSTNKLIDNTSISFIVEHIKENADQITDIERAEENHSDLIPAIYEGGAKIWECTDDLLKYLAEHYKLADWKGKSVLDLGCGCGLLGIYAFKNGSRVTFQDYNKDVLEKITIPNVVLNAVEIGEDETYNVETVKENARFYSGDWQKWSEASECSQMYDIILTSETIYNPQNQQKLLNCLFDKLNADGRVYVAAKSYYFGVGGGVRQFEQLIEKDGRFSFKSVWLSTEGVNREIIQLNKTKK